MKLMLEENFDLENVIELNESTNEKTYVIKGTFSTPGVKNRNGRVYPMAIWEDNVKEYQKELKNKTVNTLMEKEHPPRTTVDPWKAVAQIRLLEMRNNLVYGEAELLNIPETLVMRSLIDKGVKIGVSTRGVGRLGKDNLVEEYKMITVDIVSTPSDYNANLKGFNESMILESVDISSDGKGGWICTPEGCTLSETAETETEKPEVLSETPLTEAILESISCPECKETGMSYVTEAGALNVKCNSCGHVTGIQNIQKMVEADQSVIDAFWKAYDKLKNASSKKAKKYLEKIGNDIDAVIMDDNQTNEADLSEGNVESRLKIDGYSVDIEYHSPKGYIAVGKSKEIRNVIARTYFNTEDEAKEHAELEIDGYMNESKKSCGCKAKELTELFDALANSKEMVAEKVEEEKLRERFNSYMGITEAKKATQDEKSVIYDTRTKEKVDSKVYANPRNATKAMDKMDDKEYLKVASQLFYIDNISEGKDITKEVIKRLKKDGQVMVINPDEILVNLTDYDDGTFGGLDQFDNDVMEDDLKGYRLDEASKEKDMKKEASKLLASGLSFDNVMKNIMKKYDLDKKAANAIVDMGRHLDEAEMSKYFKDDMKQYQKLISDIGGYIKEYDEKLYNKFSDKKSELNKVLKTILQKVA